MSTIIPFRNIEWTAVKQEDKPEVELRKVGSNAMYLYYRAGVPHAVVIWSGNDAKQAQRYLDGIAFFRCSYTDSMGDCNIRLEDGQKLGDWCRNHR